MERSLRGTAKQIFLQIFVNRTFHLGTGSEQRLCQNRSIQTYLILAVDYKKKRAVTGMPRTYREEKESEEEMNRRGNGYLDEATERLRDEQEKDRDPKAAYEDQMSEENQETDE